SAAMEVETSMYFLMHAPKLLKNGAADQIKLKKGGTLRQFINMAMESGVRFYACEESLRDLCGIEPSEVIEGVKIVGSSTLTDLALDADSVISF
ncbi:MAG: DsrE family protein, partial [Methanomassiliicoccales archaeon]